MGKSSVAMALAEEFSGAILNADAMQVYRGFDRGTAKLPPEDRKRVPHFLLDIADPRRDFTAGDFVRAAEEARAQAVKLGCRPFLVGGSGFY
ncbi:MAG: tRNA (adenosine(37)-N6)-dimethylallyltransferase MiaA, partial [Acidobacteriota bacterium]